jgi:hypothetical protein
VAQALVETVGAKMSFNVAMCHAALDRHDQAVRERARIPGAGDTGGSRTGRRFVQIEALSAAVKADRYFAVAYFQRGVHQLAKRAHHKAVQDFNYAADVCPRAAPRWRARLTLGCMRLFVCV